MHIQSYAMTSENKFRDIFAKTENTIMGTKTYHKGKK